MEDQHRRCRNGGELISEAVDVMLGDTVREVDLDADAISRLQVAAQALDEHLGELDESPTAQDDDVPAPEDQIGAVEDVMRSIEERVNRRLEDERAPAQYHSIARKLEELRKMRLVNVSVSVRWLKDALQTATALFSEERDAGILAGSDQSLFPASNQQALTQILREYSPRSTPEMVKNLVTEIDRIATDAQDSRWKEGDRGDKIVRRQIKNQLALRSLQTDSELFDGMYEYVREHY